MSQTDLSQKVNGLENKVVSLEIQKPGSHSLQAQDAVLATSSLE